MKQYQDDLYLIPLPVPATGFGDFIGAWVYTGGPVAIIDVGPSAAAPVLLSALAQLGVERPDVILLTHIHIDHAGAIGKVSQAFPHTPVVCHPKAVAHLIDPSKLWLGTQKTLGDLAEAYGPMEAVPGDRVLSSDVFRMEAVQAVDTPGHASHHTSYIINNVLFAGEAGGVCLQVDADRFYLRPATPPRFFLETSLESIDRLAAKQSGQICYGHVGVQPDAANMLMTHRRQLLDWHGMVASQHANCQGDPEDCISRCVDFLLANDPLLAEFDTLPADVQSRERYFLTNSVRGFWGYIDNQ